MSPKALLATICLTLTFALLDSTLIAVEEPKETVKPSLSSHAWTHHKVFRKTRLCNGLDSADVNGDGFLDYVTNFEDIGEIVVVRHPGSGKATADWPATVVGKFGRAESSCFGDLDGDGWPDVAVAHGHENEDEKAGVTIVWHPGKDAEMNGSNWKNSEFIPGSVELGNYLFIRSADINGDGALDLVAGGRQARHAKPEVAEGASVGVIWLEAPQDKKQRRNMQAWKVHDVDSEIISGHGFALGDIDADGDLDIALANADWGTPQDAQYILWYENPGKNSDRLRSPWPKQVLYESSDFYTKPGVAIGDVNGDGHADIISQVDDRVIYCQNKGGKPAKFEVIEIPKPPFAKWRARPIKVVDLDADGRNEILIGLIHQDGFFPREKPAIVAMRLTGKTTDAENWETEVVKWSDGYRGKIGTRFDGEKWDNFCFDDVDRDGDLDIVANCEEYKNLGVEWFENPGKQNNTAAE